MKRLFLTALAAAAVVLGLSGPGHAEETIELKLSHFLPPVHGMHKDFMEPWARELEARTDGKVEVTIYPAGTQFGTVTQQLEQVRAGVVDIAHGLTGLPRGQLPRTTIIDLPFLTERAGTATQVLWDLFPEHLAQEYEGVKVLALHAHNGGLIHTRGTKVESMDDLKGLRIRTPSPAISSMLEHLGATPQGLPPLQVYENLDKGNIDGTVFPWDPVNSFKLAEVLDHHLDARVYTTSFFFVMNQRRYDSLPEDVRAAIDSMSGDNLIPRFGTWWDSWDYPGLQAAVRQGNEIAYLSNDERERWREALEPMIDDWLTRMEEDQGVEDARALYERTRELVAKYEQ